MMTLRHLGYVASFTLTVLAACSSSSSPDAAAGRDAAPADAFASDADGSDASDGAPGTDATDAGPPADGFAFPTPIQYVVVIVKENHTLDNFFMGFPGADTVTDEHLSNGNTIPRLEAYNRDMTADEGDLPHSHQAALTAWARGDMDGFDLLNQPPPGATYDYSHMPFRFYSETQIPNYWAYARHFALCDHFFSTVLAPSDPGHTSIIASQSPFLDDGSCPGGPMSSCNDSCLAPSVTDAVHTTYNPTTCATGTHVDGCFGFRAVPDVLPAAITWRAYGPRSGANHFDINTPFKHVMGYPDDATVRAEHFWGLDQFTSQDSRGTGLSNVSFVDVSGTGLGFDRPGIDEHPPRHPCIGEDWTVGVINHLMNSPQWPHMAIIVTWDDWGGWYDHVAPAPDGCGAEHFNTGFRLPALVISPWARNAVFHGVAEQASITRLVEDLFTPAGTTPRRLHDADPRARDATAGSLIGAFDFTPGRTVLPALPLTPHGCNCQNGTLPPAARGDAGTCP